jgi:uncharacterized membrane protein
MSSVIEPDSADGKGGLRRAALLVSGVIAYQFLVHFSLATPHAAKFASLAAALPLFLLAVWLLRRARLAPKAGGLASGLGALLIASNSAVTPALSYFLVQMAAYLTIFWVFAGTLRPGRQPLITRMARSVHGVLPGEIERYTRRVTWYWSGVLALMAAVSAALFALAPVAVWSFFANVLNAPLLAAAFVAEYLWRIARYPHFSHASMAASLGAFRNLADRGKAALHD